MEDVYFWQPGNQYKIGRLDRWQNEYKSIEWRTIRLSDSRVSVVYRIEIINLPFDRCSYAIHLHIGENLAQALKKLSRLRISYTDESLEKACPGNTILSDFIREGIKVGDADIEVSSESLYIKYPLCDSNKIEQLNDDRLDNVYYFASKAKRLVEEFYDMSIDTTILEKKLWADPITWVTAAVVITAAILLNKRDIDSKKIEQTSRNIAHSISFRSNKSGLEAQKKQVEKDLANKVKDLAHAKEMNAKHAINKNYSHYTKTYTGGLSSEITQLVDELKELTAKLKDASK